MMVSCRDAIASKNNLKCFIKEYIYKRKYLGSDSPVSMDTDLYHVCVQCCHGLHLYPQQKHYQLHQNKVLSLVGVFCFAIYLLFPDSDVVNNRRWWLVESTIRATEIPRVLRITKSSTELWMQLSFSYFRSVLPFLT